MIRRDGRGPGAMRMPGDDRPEVREVREVVESLRFYPEDLEKVDAILGQYLKTANARSAMLVDRSGRMVAGCGTTAEAPRFASLAAAAFEAAEVMMRLLGREGAAIRVYEGRALAIEMTMVGERTLLATAFDEMTTLSMVRLHEAQVRAKLRAVMDEIAVRKSEAESISRDFGNRGGPPTPPLAIA